MARKQIGEILIDTGLVDPEDVNEALRRQKLQLGEILVEMGKLKAADIEGALEVQASSTSRADRYLAYLRLTLVVLALVVIGGSVVLYQQVLEMRLRDTLDEARLSAPRILHFLEAGSPGQRLDVLRSVARLERKDEKTVVLRQALRDRSWPVRLVACTTIRAEGLGELVPDLVPLLLDDDRTVRNEAHRLLSELTGQELPQEFRPWFDWAKAQGMAVAEPKDFMKPGAGR